MTIVGVVGDIKSDGLDTATAPRIFLPLSQSPTYDAVVYLRTGMDASTLGDSVRQEVQSLDPSIPVFGVRTMDAVMKDYLAQRKFALELLGIFAGDRKSTRLNSSHITISYAVFCLKKKNRSSTVH